MELPSKVRTSEKKVRHKSTGFDHLEENTWKEGFKTHSNAFNILEQVQKKRKIDALCDNKILSPGWKRKLTNVSVRKQQGPTLGKGNKKKFSDKNNKRLTMHICEDTPILPLKYETSVFELISKVKIKDSLYSSQKEDRKQSRAAFFLQKIENRKQARKKKVEQNKEQCIRELQTVNKNYRNSQLSPPCEQTSLVSLISKFKFQNLKATDSTFEESVPKLQKNDNSFHLFKTFENELQTSNSVYKRAKMNKTVMGAGWTQETASSPLSKRISVLSPWEVDNHEMATAFDYFQVQNPKG